MVAVIPTIFQYFCGIPRLAACSTAVFPTSSATSFLSNNLPACFAPIVASLPAPSVKAVSRFWPINEPKLPAHQRKLRTPLSSPSNAFWFKAAFISSDIEATFSSAPFAAQSPTSCNQSAPVKAPIPCAISLTPFHAPICTASTVSATMPCCCFLGSSAINSVSR